MATTGASGGSGYYASAGRRWKRAFAHMLESERIAVSTFAGR